MTVQAVTAQEDIQAQLRDPATATPWRTNEVYTAEEVDDLIAAAIAAAIAEISGDSYTPTVLSSGGATVTDKSFVYQRIGKIVMVQGRFTVDFADVGETLSITLPIAGAAAGTLKGQALSAPYDATTQWIQAMVTLALDTGNAKGEWLLTGNRAPIGVATTIEVSFAYSI